MKKKSGKSVSIKIGGSIFTIQSHVPSVRIKQIEGLINRKFEEIKSKSAKLSFQDCMALTLLYMTDTLIDAEEKNIRVRKEAIQEVKFLKEAAAEIGEFIEEKLSTFEDEAS